MNFQRKLHHTPILRQTMYDFVQSKKSVVRVCAAKRSNESPSGAFKRLNGLAQQDGGDSPRQVPVCRTAPNRGKAPAFQNGCRGFFVYFKMISPFSSASTTRVPPEARLPSIRRSAAGSSTALRMTRRKSRAPNLPPSAFFTSALRAAGV